MKSTRTIVYGITNCDTVKKSRAWLVAHAIDHDFHDFKKQGLPLAEVDRWIAQTGYDMLLNRRGTTWRKLPEVIQASVVDAASAKAVMQLNSSVIKRPIIQWQSGQITAGFDETGWLQLIGSS